MKTIHKNYKNFGLITALSLLLIQSVFADTFSVQGVLRDPLGKTVADGAYAMTFRLYEVETSGAPIWEETQGSVPVLHGVYNAELGAVVSLSPVPFNTTYWMGLSIEGGVELEPRMKLLKTPAAMSVLGTDNVFPSRGSVGVGTPAPDAALHIIADPLVIDDLKIEDEAGNPKLVVNDQNRVGVGVDVPDAGLHIKTNNDLPSDKKVLIEKGNGDNILVITGDGKMGVNVETPLQALDIEGNVNMRAGGAILFDDGSSLASAYFGGSASSLTNNGTILVTADADNNASGNVEVVMGSTTQMLIANNGNVSIGNGNAAPADKLDVNGGVRATTFLDKNNAGYYLDPSSPGLSGNFAGVIEATAFKDENNPGYYVDPASNSYINTLQAAGNLQAPRFYDLDNTGFYLDPHSVSYLNDIRPSVIYDRDNTGYYLNPNGTSLVNTFNSNASMSAPIFYDANDGNYYLDPNGISYLNDIRPNIIYDRNDTGFYLDPNGTSRVNTLYTGNVQVDGTLRFNPPSAGYDIIVDNNGYEPMMRPSSGNWGYLGNETYYWYKTYTASIYRNNEYAISDRRTKQNINPITGSLEKIQQLNPVRYDIDTSTHPFFKDRDIKEEELTTDHLGFIAQELMEIVPEMVVFDKEHELYVIRNYEQLFPVVVEAIQELKAEADEKDALINDLMRRIEAIENR